MHFVVVVAPRVIIVSLSHFEVPCKMFSKIVNKNTNFKMSLTKQSTTFIYMNRDYQKSLGNKFAS